MKIVHLCLAGTITDGWSYQENLLAKYHRQLEHEVTIITSCWVYNSDYKLYKSDKLDYFLEDGTHVLRLNMRKGSKPNGRLARFIGVVEALQKASPDILFIHGCQFLDMRSVVKYLKKHSGVKVYVDNHADFSNSATTFLSKLLNKYLWGYTARLIEPYTSKFYGVLPARCDFLINVYGAPTDKVELLVMGADDDLLTKAEQKVDYTRKKYNILNDDFLIVTGGKIDKFKTQTILLMEAVKNIDNNKLKLIVFGPVENDLKKRVDEFVDGAKIQYLGWQGPQEGYDLFAIANLVVFPGRHSVYWEQVAGMGIPMIVKDWEGTHHVDKGGNVEFLYKDSVEEIKDKVLSVVSNQSKYEYMLQMAKRCKKDFSYREIARKCIE